MKIKSAASLFGVFLITCLILFPVILQASDQEILVTKITIKGNTVISSEELSRIVKNYEGKNLSFADMQKVAALITNEYKKRGYIISSAYVPEQNIINGVVEIAVLEGKVGDVVVQGSHKYYSTDFIKKHFDPVKKGQALDQDSLERALLVLNEYPKLRVQATLQAGKEFGTSDLIVNAENSFPMHLTLDYNNFGSKYTSRSRYGVTFDLGNLIKEGALLSLRGVTGDDPSEMIFGRVSYSIPLNTLGTRTGAYYARGDTDVGREFAALGMKGKSEAFGIYVSHPFIKKTSRTLTGEFGLDAKNEKQEIMGTDTSKDYIRSLHGLVTFEDIDTTGKTIASFAVSQGLGPNLGGMPDNSDMSSRYRADNRFTKFNLDLIRLQRLYPFYKGEALVHLILKASGQWSINSLVAIEQFSIGGADSVRGYPESEYMGDHGYSATAELRISPLAKKELLQLAFFIDNGGVIVRNTVPGQEEQHNITGGGAGVRLQLPYDINIRADVGYPLDPSESSEDKKPLFYVQGLKRF